MEDSCLLFNGLETTRKKISTLQSLAFLDQFPFVQSHFSSFSLLMGIKQFFHHSSKQGEPLDWELECPSQARLGKIDIT